jgi:hypothetical protein
MPGDTDRVRFGRRRAGTTHARSSTEHTGSVAGLLVSGQRGRRRGTRKGEARTKQGDGAGTPCRREDACRLRGGQRQRRGRRQEREAEVGDAAVSMDGIQGLGSPGGSRSRLVFSMSGGGLVVVVRVAVPAPGMTVRLGPKAEPLPARAVRVVGPVPGDVGRRRQDAAADEHPDLKDAEPSACPPHRGGLYSGPSPQPFETRMRRGTGGRVGPKDP